MAKGIETARRRIELASRENIRTLSLSGLGLGEVPESIRSLKSLTSLDLSSNPLAVIPGWIGELTNLRELGLDFCRLARVPREIGQLSALTRLNLAQNGLVVLPDELANLRNIRTLNLSGNYIKRWPDWIQSWLALEELVIERCRLKTIPEFIREMPCLTALDVTGNEIAVLPAWLASLTSLSKLNVGRNELTDVPAWISELRELETLSLNNNEISQLPESIGDFTKLSQLMLHDNLLTSLPETIGRLQYLIVLTLDNNEISVLPSSLGRLQLMAALRLGGNPLTFPPPEIVDGGLARIMPFLRSSADEHPEGKSVAGRGGAPDEAQYLWQSKVLVVGEATVGKTSLAKQLSGGTYDPDEGQTHGLHVEQLGLSHPRNKQATMQLTVWDFGGQLEYRAIQRLYLTDRSLYLLVWNSRARWQDGKILAWLDAITARAPKSPVIIVATHADELSPAPLPEDLGDLYPQIIGAYAVDSKTGMGIAGLRAQIRQAASSLPLMGLNWPVAWAKAAHAVRSLDGHVAEVSQLRKTMADAGISDEESMQAIIGVLHDLGDIVFFADDFELNQRVILRPQWLDSRVTSVLDSRQVTDRRGILTRGERDRLWGDLADIELMDRLIRIMERFDLAI